MDKANYFSFDAYALEGSELHFDYHVQLEAGGSIPFRETILLPAPPDSSLPAPVIDSLLYGLHLALGSSYWKLHCAPRMEVCTRPLTPPQASFFTTLYEKGLGEFFYRNNIDFRRLVNFPSGPAAHSDTRELALKDRPLVGLGGGKDSLVTAELLRQQGKGFTGLLIETNKEYQLVRSVAREAGISLLIVKRRLDPKLPELNQSGRVYNGHIPISSVYAFLGVLACAFYGYRSFIVSNERSANYGNVEYLGAPINHQWSKSEEFEGMFNAYVRENISPSLAYTSLLRPYWELKIVEMFAANAKYFSLFTSCNRNFASAGQMHGKRWCGKCAKCAFAYATFAAFLGRQELERIFGANLFADETLLPLYRQLLGVEDIKPFDCVGTDEEVRLAFHLAQQRGEHTGTPAMEMFRREAADKVRDWTALKRKILGGERG